MANKPPLYNQLDQVKEIAFGGTYFTELGGNMVGLADISLNSHLFY